MYIAMNRFKVVTGTEGDFETVWRNRDSSLAEVPGFVEFRLLRGKSNEEEGYTLYSSHTVWKSEEVFQNWTKSENFRAAHRNAGDRKAMYKGPPVFEGFNVVEGI
ncbi:antibiotic biosynthesis monooxygenase [Rhizobium bangladeshense]|uniref:antibiotic biosynthesis monooxygenase family protein n=1 Tax=Rhizobium bangladeshense TaxID=1138189 RepID=UPI001A9A0042|nr:antibiotic biosynthesis monooxygenase [Rhizobium bangladeshense]MBX4888168.1 antibiotic biosynthesis monooxygenase [Rhizobium bangladeshense]MBX4923793.1 antibiotic biosynthesis monooxygenase [Rhizobium bangladeshense]QSY93583.1 antibiotic biosynthesis monooxygenase [Rhizobium bangladeshense]